MIINRNECAKGLIGETQPSQLICLTLYNEEAVALGNTLVSLARNVSQLPAAPATVVAIIADGKDRMSSSSKLLLSQLGLDYHFPDSLMGDAIDAVGVTLPASSVATLCGADAEDINCSKNITILLCTKNNNCGKLDSHWWFFRKIAPCYEPDFCFQIDAGTILGSDAIANMRTRFETNPNAAALSSKVLIKSDDPLNLLEAFQVGDFVIQKTIMWPSESLLGYLSVVPGQFCGVRYSSLTKRSPVMNKGPLDLYLRGMECESAFEKTMFLAEDRVMGFELLAHQGSDNRLEFCEDSTCYTDECVSVDDFLGQRRRWVNSAFMCRTWMIGNMHRYFRDSSSSVLTKMHTGLSLTSMVANHILEWFQPLINFLILAVTFFSINTLGEQYGIDKKVTLTVFIVIAAGWLTPLLLALLGIFQRLSARAVNQVLYAASSAVALAICVNISASLQGGVTAMALSPAVIVLGIFSGCAWLGAQLLGNETRREMGKSFIQYILLVNPVYLMLFCYGFLNLDDSSWGTKGLSRAAVDTSNKSANLAGKLKLFRFNFVLVWLAANISLMMLSLQYQVVFPLLTIVTLSSLYLTITGLLGVFWLTLNSASNKQVVMGLNEVNQGV